MSATWTGRRVVASARLSLRRTQAEHVAVCAPRRPSSPRAFSPSRAGCELPSGVIRQLSQMMRTLRADGEDGDSGRRRR